jgi:anti-repressor protein
MQELMKSGIVTSLELVEQINIFREQERNRGSNDRLHANILHKSLLEIIRDEFSEEIGRGELMPSSYLNSQNKEHPMFEITHSQAKQVLARESKLVRKAVIAYIEKLESQIKTTAPVAISIEDALIQQLLVTKAIRIEQEQIRTKQVEQDARILQIEAKQATRPEYFTVMGYAILNGAKVGLSLAAQIGRKAKAICSTKGYHIDKIHDPRFGQVGCYPADVLKEAFGTISFT